MLNLKGATLGNIPLIELFMLITFAVILIYLFAIFLSNTYITLSPKSAGILSTLTFLIGMLLMAFIIGNGQATLEVFVLLIIIWIWLIWKAIHHTRHKRAAQQQISQMKGGNNN
jgi:uncharacterized membrane protein